MVMKIRELNSEDIKLFADLMPEEAYKHIYTDRKGKLIIKGFREGKVPVNTYKKRFPNDIKTNRMISENTQYFFEASVQKDVSNKKQELIDKGIAEENALILAIYITITPVFRSLYLKLSDYDEDTISNYLKKMDEYDAISEIIDVRTKRAANEKENKPKSINKEKDNKTDSLEKDIKEIKKALKNIPEIDTGNFVTVKDKDEADLRFISLEESIKTIDSKVTGDKRYKELSAKFNQLKSEKDTLQKTTAAEIKTLKEEIDILKKQLQDSFAPKDDKGFEVEDIIEKEYAVESTGNIDDWIFDVAVEMFSQKAYETFANYIKEVLFSKKPVLANRKNAEMITKIIADIIAGGNYSIVTINEDYKEPELIKMLNEKESSGKNQVILIRNLVNCNEFDRVIHTIRSLSNNVKVVMDVRYDVEIRFLNPELINDIIFFSGKYEDVEPEYKYYLEISERMSVSNGKFKETVNKINDNVKDYALTNVNYEGILAYSVIPFTAISNGDDVEDLINRIDDENIRTKCRNVLREE